MLEYIKRRYFLSPTLSNSLQHLYTERLHLSVRDYVSRDSIRDSPQLARFRGVLGTIVGKSKLLFKAHAFAEVYVRDLEIVPQIYYLLNYCSTSMAKLFSEPVRVPAWLCRVRFPHDVCAPTAHRRGKALKAYVFSKPPGVLRAARGQENTRRARPRAR